jgi:hypothetical protein
MNILIKKAQASASVLAILALSLGGFGSLFTGASLAHAAGPVTVTIEKYIDGAQATAVSANNADFPMLATYTIGGTAGGPSPFALSASGYNGNPTPYQAMSGGLSTGDDYSVNEDTGGAVVGASCSTGQPFALTGYTSGATLAEAQAGTPSATPPAFVGLTTDEFVIVWNTTCPGPVVPSPVPTPSPVSPTNGSATTTAGQTSASWTSVTDTAGGITYVFQVAHDSATHADGSFTNAIYNSSALATTTISTVGTTDGTYYWHVQATDASGAMSAWSTTQMFIVDNTGSAGSIGGNVNTPPGSLAVSAIDAVDTSAVADGTFANGWKYVFHVTVPSDETHLAMKFADWLNTSGAGTIPAGANMRISSAQADNSGATVLISAANTYSTPALHITGDLDAATPGDQVEVTVEVAVPAGTVNGSYSTSYGVQTLP